ncbi:MAG: hypothetical protein II797_01985 [Clostridia bacterium]|nr:hypothetical protein [Clostridia bacterium]
MSFLLIGLGLVFFANPIVGIVDVIPDAIGCALIIFGVSKLACLFETFEKVRKYSFWCLAVSVFHILMMLVSSSFNGSDNIAASLSASILDLIFFLLLIFALTDGVNELFMFSQQKSFSEEQKQILKRLEHFRVFSVVFIIVRVICTLGSQIVFLQLESPTGWTFGEFDLSPSAPYLAAVTAAVALAVGIPWAVEAFRLFLSVRKTEVIIHQLENRYKTEVEYRPGFRASKEAVLWQDLLVFTMIFSLNIYFSHCNFYFGCIASLGALAFFLTQKSGKLNLVLSVLYGAVSFVSSWISVRFFGEFTVTEFILYGSGAAWYYGLLASMIVRGLLFILLLLQVAKTVQSRLKTDFSLVRISMDHPETEEDREVVSDVKKKGTIAFVAMVFLPVMDLMNLLLSPNNPYLISVLTYLVDLAVVILFFVWITAIRKYPYQMLKD